jgi:hypothetical protein
MDTDESDAMDTDEEDQDDSEAMDADEDDNDESEAMDTDDEELINDSHSSEMTDPHASLATVNYQPL